MLSILSCVSHLLSSASLSCKCTYRLSLALSMVTGSVTLVCSWVLCFQLLSVLLCLCLGLFLQSNSTKAEFWVYLFPAESCQPQSLIQRQMWTLKTINPCELCQHSLLALTAIILWALYIFSFSFFLLISFSSYWKKIAVQKAMRKWASAPWLDFSKHFPNEFMAHSHISSCTEKTKQNTNWFSKLWSPFESKRCVIRDWQLTGVWAYGVLQYLSHIYSKSCTNHPLSK